MTFDTPEHHYEIVTELLKGKFILWDEIYFQTLVKEQDFYKTFFKNSFGYELVLRKEFAYLSSKSTNEEFSKRFTVILSILCYEWNLKGREIKDFLEQTTFSAFEVKTLLENSTYSDILKLIKFKKQEDVEKFLKELDQRNIIKLDNDRETFEFTKAVDLFFEFAKEIAESKLKSVKNQ
jgi:hypothetical protein